MAAENCTLDDFVAAAGPKRATSTENDVAQATLTPQTHRFTLGCILEQDGLPPIAANRPRYADGCRAEAYASHSILMSLYGDWILSHVCAPLPLVRSEFLVPSYLPAIRFTPNREVGSIVTYSSAARLSKSRFVAGVQCHKLLWWKVHEPDAVELQPDRVLQDRFDQGQQVGKLAWTLFPGGLLIDLPHTAVEERLEMTREALTSDAPAIFEATFLEDDTFVAVDVLERALESIEEPGQRPGGLVQSGALRGSSACASRPALGC